MKAPANRPISPPTHSPQLRTYPTSGPSPLPPGFAAAKTNSTSSTPTRFSRMSEPETIQMMPAVLTVPGKGGAWRNDGS